MGYLEDPVISKNRDADRRITVIRYLGDATPDILCDRVKGGTIRSGKAPFGLHKVCETCEFRFLCITNCIEEIADIVDPQYDVKITEFGDAVKKFIKVRT